MMSNLQASENTQSSEKFKQGKKINQAFTLIESIIVMVILGLSLSGATYLMITVTNSIATNRQRITASYLVQECMELTRNLRDSAWKQNLPWNCAFRNISGALTQGDVFRISVDPDSSPNTSLGNLQQYCRSDLGILLEQNPSDFTLKKKTVLYGHMSGDDTIFSRKLLLSEVEDQSAKFTCEVDWKNRGNLQKISMSQILTNWQR